MSILNNALLKTSSLLWVSSWWGRSRPQAASMVLSWSVAHEERIAGGKVRRCPTDQLTMPVFLADAQQHRRRTEKQQRQRSEALVVCIGDGAVPIRILVEVRCSNTNNRVSIATRQRRAASDLPLHMFESEFFFLYHSTSGPLAQLVPQKAPLNIARHLTGLKQIREEESRRLPLVLIVTCVACTTAGTVTRPAAADIYIYRWWLLQSEAFF